VSKKPAYMDFSLKHAVQGIMTRVVISGLLLKGVAIITPSLMLRRMSTQSLTTKRKMSILVQPP